MEVLEQWKCFNPSVGILFVQAYPISERRRTDGTFQSLGRDSVCSSSRQPPHRRRSSAGFNPSVGILFVQAHPWGDTPIHSTEFQSLGRDSVCSSSTRRSPIRAVAVCFNPSVGILFVQAGQLSLVNRLAVTVSIPRSGFCLFKRGGIWYYYVKINMFQSLGRDSVCSSRNAQMAVHGATPSFNPSVGILFVQALGAVATPGLPGWFQSLGRDSVCSSLCVF